MYQPKWNLVRTPGRSMFAISEYKFACFLYIAWTLFSSISNIQPCKWSLNLSNYRLLLSLNLTGSIRGFCSCFAISCERRIYYIYIDSIDRQMLYIRFINHHCLSRGSYWSVWHACCECIDCCISADANPFYVTRIIWCDVMWYMIWYMIGYDVMYDMVCYDVMWYMMWCHMIWCDIWFGMIWYDVMWCNIWHGMIWYDVMWWKMKTITNVYACFKPPVWFKKGRRQQPPRFVPIA